MTCTNMQEGRFDGYLVGYATSGPSPGAVRTAPAPSLVTDALVIGRSDRQVPGSAVGCSEPHALGAVRVHGQAEVGVWGLARVLPDSESVFHLIPEAKRAVLVHGPAASGRFGPRL